MEINYKQQDKHSPDRYKVYVEMNGQIIREVDYLEIDNVIRDISFIRQQSTNYTYIYAGQFRFPEMMTLPYWEYLFLKGDIHENELRNIQDGCLLILFLFFVEIYDDEGIVYIYKDHLWKKIIETLNFFVPTTKRQKKIIEGIKILEKHKETPQVQFTKIGEEPSVTAKLLGEINEWVYKEFIENYYWETAKSFGTNKIKTVTMRSQLLNRGNNNQTDKP